MNGNDNQLDSVIVSLAREYFTGGELLSVESGKVTALIGPSGIGKSEFLRRLVDTIRLESPKLVQGRDTLYSYIPQDLSFFPDLSLLTSIHGLSRRHDIDAILTLAEPLLIEAIQPRLSWSPNSLSGGEKRALALTCAIAAHPELLIIDETLVSMDVCRLNWATQLIRLSLQKEEVGRVLIVTHDAQLLDAVDCAFRLAKAGTATVLEPLPLSNPRESGLGQSSMSSRHPRSERKLHSAPVLPALRLASAGLFALSILTCLLVSPRYFAPDPYSAVVPTIPELATLMSRHRAEIISAGVWTFTNSVMSLTLTLTLCFGFWIIGVLAPGMRRTIGAAWIAFQSIPIIILCPVVVMLFGPRGRIFEVMIGTFIAFFPLVIVGTRLIASTPPDYVRAYRATTVIQRYIVATRFARGDLIRASIACAPLCAIGVIVAEYMAPKFGIGSLAFFNMTQRVNVGAAYAYVLAAGFVALSVAILLTLLGTLGLARDISPE